MLTREEVSWAYRILLGREPESEAAIVSNMVHPDLQSLRDAFFNSAEFNARSGAIPVGLHLDVAQFDVESEGTATQQKRMLSGIAKAWQKFGEDDPHWSVLTADEFRADRIAQTIDHFYATGADVVTRACAMLLRNGASLDAISSVVDFGCGVGRLSFALAERFKSVLAVDVSLPHIRLAEEHAAKIGSKRVKFQVMRNLQELDDLPSSDLIFSQIVLQHNPPPIIAQTLKRLFMAVAPGGYALFQVPTYIHGYSFKVKQYLSTDQEQMEMNALPQRVVFAIARESGCFPLEVREDTLAGDANMVSQTFLFMRPAVAA